MEDIKNHWEVRMMMLKRHRLLSFIIAIVMVVGMNIPAYAGVAAALSNSEEQQEQQLI